MSNLLQNKQMIHVASELVVLVGVVYYFNKKNKKLMSYIEDLSQRFEEQEDVIQKHEQALIAMSNMIKQLEAQLRAQNAEQNSVTSRQKSSSRRQGRKSQSTKKRLSAMLKPRNVSSDTVEIDLSDNKNHKTGKVKREANVKAHFRQNTPPINSRNSSRTYSDGVPVVETSPTEVHNSGENTVPNMNDDSHSVGSTDLDRELAEELEELKQSTNETDNSAETTKTTNSQTEQLEHETTNLDNLD